ncbi:hypothetical protein BDV93DRAFT_519274 [Ceratobasidium sp. AG-I]|nr:hypothetical protein BDV93DRAFT_519274 [Ceratobasidium sp. AG-I]
MSSTTGECSKALPHLLRFTRLTISGHPPSFVSQAPDTALTYKTRTLVHCQLTWRDARNPNVISVWASASFFCASWKFASVLLNCCRSSTCFSPNAHSPPKRPSLPTRPTPSASQPAHETSPRIIHCKHPNDSARPSALGNIASFPALVLSIKIDPVIDARNASWFLIVFKCVTSLVLAVYRSC